MGLPLAYRDFRAGLDTKDAPYLLDEGLGALPCRDVQNIQATTAGAIVKRNGLVTFSSPADTFTSLFSVEATAAQLLVGAGGTKLYKVTTGGVASSIKTGLTNNLRWEGFCAPVVSGQGTVFLMNGTDTPQQWDGAAGSTSAWTNASGGVAVPNGKYCIYANNQVFAAGVAATPSRVFWSAIADPTNWDPASATGAGFADLDPGDGQAITGIGRVGPYVLVTKARKLFIIVDPATATIRRLADNVGCIAHRSIATGPTGTYFLAEDRGVYLTNGSKLEPISDKIQPTLDLVDGQKANAAGSCFNGHYYLSVAGAGSGANDTTLDWDETVQSWWKHTFGSNQFAIWHPTASAQLYSAKPSSAIVDQCFVTGVTQDNGVSFKWRWAGPWQSPSYHRRRLFPTPQYRKRMRQIRFDGSGAVDFSLATDFAGGETLMKSNLFSGASVLWGDVGLLWGDPGASAFWGGTPVAARTRMFPSQVANAFSVVFSATSTTADSVLSYTMYLTDRSDQQ